MLSEKPNIDFSNSAEKNSKFSNTLFYKVLAERKVNKFAQNIVNILKMLRLIKMYAFHMSQDRATSIRSASNKLYCTPKYVTELNTIRYYFNNNS